MRLSILDLHCLNAMADDDASGEYVRTSSVPDHADGLWFHITDRGRRQLDENWVEE